MLLHSDEKEKYKTDHLQREGSSCEKYEIRNLRMTITNNSLRIYSRNCKKNIQTFSMPGSLKIWALLKGVVKHRNQFLLIKLLQLKLYKDVTNRREALSLNSWTLWILLYFLNIQMWPTNVPMCSSNSTKMCTKNNSNIEFNWITLNKFHRKKKTVNELLIFKHSIMKSFHQIDCFLIVEIFHVKNNSVFKNTHSKENDLAKCISFCRLLVLGFSSSEQRSKLEKSLVTIFVL